MRLGRSAGLSVAALTAQRARASLTLAGIAIGVASVLVTTAIGAGAQREIVERIDAMGTNLLVVRPAQARWTPVSINRERPGIGQADARLATVVRRLPALQRHPLAGRRVRAGVAQPLTEPVLGFGRVRAAVGHFRSLPVAFLFYPERS